ncbi:TcdA/TcdB pore-forming domain-containing protein [Pseudomonas atagonensis]|uniref:TcdA/TcdB pore-forming domain-containing protein n=1 Tax=Pseudomonas atagonensis TaxID=2609964 RepID=UPI00140CFA59|nr:TcdA/TcdB pore-forming domain-containing protein [Pseudomonas atagonensis]
MAEELLMHERYEWESTVSVSEVETALADFKGTHAYEAVLRYHSIALLQDTSQDMFQVISLLKESLQNLRGQSVNVGLSELVEKVERYHLRLQNTLAISKREVPRHLHFVWVGGAMFGANQRDYFNIWKARAPKDFTFSIWYDPQALMAFDVSRTITQAAKADAMLVAADKRISRVQLIELYEARLVALRRQAFDFIQQAQLRGVSPDEARIELLVEAFGQDRSQLEMARARYLQSHLDRVDDSVRLRNAREEFGTHFLWSAYDREISLRGNFAAASDIVRLQAEHLDGGTYSDLDYLPPLADEMGGVNVSKLDSSARSGVLQLILDHNPQLMPGRDGEKYGDLKKNIPSEYFPALEAFAKSSPDVAQVFAQLTGASAPVDIFGMGSPFDANGDSPRLMNSLIVAHPNAGMTLSTMKLIRYFYDVIEAVELELDRRGLAWEEAQVLSVTQNKLREIDFPFSGDKALKQRWSAHESRIISAIVSYHRDGVVPGAEGTITLTGPGALLMGAEFFTAPLYTVLGRSKVQALQHIQKGYNAATEEELISGWKERDDTKGTWVESEQQDWRDGKFKARYQGNFQELLKPGNTLTFKRGWPVVEGKPVLITAIVQRLIDELGEPFIRAMTDKLSGDVVFDKRVTLDYDERRQVLGQTVSEIPLSVGASPASNLNELLVHLARGSLPIDQLSPLQRTVVGGLFGADSLDTAGFADAWQQVQALASETGNGSVFARYAAIEKVLHKRQAPAFQAGLAQKASRVDQSARELKALALTEPLTLNQWGQHIARVNSTAQWEYRTQILKRGAPVREQFFTAGAVSARQMPQAFLVHTPGDPGRRCYPLALLMAAALTRGESAERALIGRVANASLAPNETDSQALLKALDELGDVHMSDVGMLLGMQDLQSIVQSLESKTASSVLLLDTGSHALLAAKIISADSVAYRFFEPNFAVYGFAEALSLQQGIETYLSRNGGELARLYGLSDVTDWQFNVVELDTVSLAERILPSNLQVGSLLDNAPIPGGQAISVWDHQSLLRTRSLSENARMGEGLAQLDARYLAREFDLATTRLRSEHSLGSEYLPLLDAIENASDGHFTLTMVDSVNPQNTLKVTSTDTRFIKIKKHVQRLVEKFAGRSGRPGESDGGSRLSFAFAIQTLMTEMRSREYRAKTGAVPALSVALQVQAYVSYAQLTFGVVTDSVQVINLVRQVAASERALLKQQASLTGRLLGRAPIVGGIGFSLVNIGFDIHGLTVATNQEERSRLTTQLVFNVAALGLDLLALAAGGTLSAAASVLALPLLGIGIGVTAIASNLGQISDKARAVGRHLFMIHEAYGPEGVKRQDGVLSFAGEAVITELDLQARRVLYDSQKFFALEPATLGLPSYSGKAEDLHRAINIRQAMWRPEVFEFGKEGDEDLHAVVLPCTPDCYYGYEYQLGSSGFNPDDDLYDRLRNYHTVDEGAPAPDGELEVGLRTAFPNILDAWKTGLEYDPWDDKQRFQFFSTAPFPHILYKLYPVNKPTKIRVRLDNHARYLVIPELPREWQHLLSYEIVGQSGLYQLTLTPGVVSVQLDIGKSLDNPVSWMINAPWATEDQVSFDGIRLTVDGIRIPYFTGLLQLKGGELYQFDPQRKSWVLLSVTLNNHDPDTASALQKPERADMPVVLDRLRQLSQINRLGSAFVPLHRFLVPFNPASDAQLSTGYYDVAADRVLYVRDLPVSVRGGVVLGASLGEHAWFYHPEYATVWRVDVRTGRIRHAYRLLSPRKGSRIVGCELTADANLRVVQEKTTGELSRFTLEYLIAGDKVTFVHLNAYEEHFREDVVEPEYWKEPLSRFRQPDGKLDELLGLDVPVSSWTSAPFIGLRGHFEGKTTISGWVRLSDYRFYLNDDALYDSPVQKIMLMWETSDNDAMLFYDVANKSLIRGFSNPAGHDTFLDEIIASDVAEVTHSAGHYIVTKDSGQMFEIDKNGLLTFVGVGKRWLELHPDWLSALPAVVTEQGKQPFPVIGLSDFTHNALLATWCFDNRLLVSQVGLGKELALLGLTPDGQAAWLFDIEAGQLYRQKLSPTESLREAFTDGMRLRHPQHLPPAQKVWSEWSFVEVLNDGQGLWGRTREGVNLALTDQQPARIIGVENHWARAGQAGLSLQSRLKNLLSGHAHAPVIPVENTGGHYKYYLAEQDRLVEVGARHDGQWFDFLGMQNESEPWVFDPVDRNVQGEKSTPRTWIANGHAMRDGEVLTLESYREALDLKPLLLDGVDTQILAFGLHTQTCRVSQEAWLRLACIVIDCRRLDEVKLPVEHTLSLEMQGSERLLMSEVQGNLLLIDPDSAHTLIVRDVIPLDGQPRVPMHINCAIEGREHRLTIESLLTALKKLQETDQTIELKAVIETLTT